MKPEALAEKIFMLDPLNHYHERLNEVVRDAMRDATKEAFAQHSADRATIAAQAATIEALRKALDDIMSLPYTLCQSTRTLEVPLEMHRAARSALDGLAAPDNLPPMCPTCLQRHTWEHASDAH